MDIRDKEEAAQLCGRMMESCDIELAIDTGQFKTVEDVRLAVRSRSEAISRALKNSGLFPSGEGVNEKLASLRKLYGDDAEPIVLGAQCKPFG